jgi:hypothetical protein
MFKMKFFLHIFLLLSTILIINGIKLDDNEDDDDRNNGGIFSGDSDNNNVKNSNKNNLFSNLQPLQKVKSKLEDNTETLIETKVKLNKFNSKNQKFDDQKVKSDDIVEDEDLGSVEPTPANEIDEDNNNNNDEEDEDDEDEDNSDEDLTTTNQSLNNNNKDRKNNSIGSGDSLQTKLLATMMKPGILTGIIGAVVIALLTSILLIMFIIYRMRKKDEGSYALEDTKKPLSSYEYRNVPTKEFYA